MGTMMGHGEDVRTLLITHTARALTLKREELLNVSLAYSQMSSTPSIEASLDS